MALDPERMETLRLRRAGRRFCGFFTRIVKKTCCIERVLSHLGELGRTTDLLGVAVGVGVGGCGDSAI